MRSKLILVMVSMVAAARLPARASDVDFDRDVRPVFGSHCIACHGGVKKAGGVSFVSRGEAIVEGDSGVAAIVPGDPDASEVIRRVTADADERMPPKDHGRSLTPQEITLLREWIASGAEWREHWSLVPPQDPPEPKVARSDWPQVPFDRFVLARLASEGMDPSARARAAEWLRRVSLDLIGLPPTIDEYEAFVADGGDEDGEHAAQARERVVDRLLASPAFGERWATVWLDLARYADTFGFEKDPTRTIWPWRDWVIRAFNDDMPFDAFTIRQLAGDLLPEATPDDVLATAFHRNTQTNTEGGTDDEEYRMASVIDRVNTTWTVWQATTFGCVQCHAHPYDAYRHDDYYRFLAYFDGTRDTDLANEFPTLPVTVDGTVAATLHEADAARRSLHREAMRVAEASTAWEPIVVESVATTGGTLATTGSGGFAAAGTLPVGVRYDLDVVVPPGTTAIRLAIDLDGGGTEAAPPQRGAVVSRFTITEQRDESASDDKPDATPASPRRIEIAEVVPDLLDGPFRPEESLEKNAAGFGGFPVLDRPRWCVMVLADPDTVPADGRLRLSLTQSAASNQDTQACTLRHFRLATSADPAWSRLGAARDRRDAWKRIRDATKAIQAFGGPRVPVLREQEAEARRVTHVFARGNRLEPRDAVAPGLPAVMAASDGSDPTPADRLGMARWLVGPSNPLAARVLANRLWAEMFGAGIVETLEDFGTSGTRPSHPDLLDHLACRLVAKHRWSVKQFLREIAVSSTYGQRASATREMLARDPANRLLARGPRQRLSAEMVRDQALAWSGRLSTKQFGPPVFPPQPEGIWRSVYSKDVWTTSEGEDRYRRAIYTFVKRTAGYPASLTFDAPSREFCSPRRVPTNTPLQPLVTLNDPMMVELAEGFAARMHAAGASPREQITSGCRMITLEPPPAPMVDALLALHAAAVAGGAEADSAESAAGAGSPLTVVATALLNLDRSLAR